MRTLAARMRCSITVQYDSALMCESNIPMHLYYRVVLAATVSDLVWFFLYLHHTIVLGTVSVKSLGTFLIVLRISYDYLENTFSMV